MRNFFKLEEHNTDVRTEFIAGLTTFLSMVYILAVNPSILSAAGMNPAGVFTATVVSAVFATLFMAVFANYPIALAPGMGLNAYFAFSVCIPLAEAGIQNPWEIALTAVLAEGILFVILSFFKFRETLVNKVPMNLKLGITAGIGLFITIIGFKNAGIVVSDPSTLLALGDLSSAPVALGLIGIIIISILYHYKVMGYVLWGILATWVLGMFAQTIGWYQVDPTVEAYSLFPGFVFSLPSMPELFSFNFEYLTNHFIDFTIIVFSFLFVDLFDTVGTLIGVANEGNLLDEDGNLPKVGAALGADAFGTILGACLGTSTVTSYVESSAGVASGGRTGLTSVFTAGFFALALFLSPLFLAIPGFATAPALVFVGLLMLNAVTKMNFDDDVASAVGGFLAIVMMPFCYSIADGIMFGILSFVIIRVFQGRSRDVHGVLWISAVLFIIKIVTMII